MSKRVFDDNGEYTPEGHVASNKVHARVRMLMDELTMEGFTNPRELAYLIGESASTSACEDIILLGIKKRKNKV